VGGGVQDPEPLSFLAGQDALHLLRDVGRSVVPGKVDEPNVGPGASQFREELDGLVGLAAREG
jgi:hypothetical protein